MKEYLLSIGFEQRLPWQFHSDSYMIVELESDSHSIPLWAIYNKRYDDKVYHGRIGSVEEFKLIFRLVKEDYDLTEEELKELKG